MDLVEDLFDQADDLLFTQ